VATAHQQDDTIETVFFHFLRGTGIKGMTGIPVSNEKIIRPLLHHSKKEIEAYAVIHSIEYRNDSSNKKEEYTRNKLRNTILPLIEESFPQLRQTMSKNINRFNEVNEIYQDAIEKMRRRLLEQRGQDYYIPIRKLQHVSPLQTITYELIKPFHFSFEQAIELIRLFDSHTGAYIQSHSHRIIRNREMLIITSIDTSASDMIIVNASSEEISCADFTVSFSRLAGPLDIRSKEKNVEWIDCQQLKYPLLLRKWRQGDYLYPLGMTKKKKVSRMLIDEKIALPEKEKIWVLESDKKIVWVSGIRIDHRYRMTNTTADIVQIRLVKNTTA
jgi:tRNA(Ile)-lysidine synthase